MSEILPRHQGIRFETQTMTLDLRKLATRDGPVLLDGGWGTQLQERGLPVGENADVWNLQHPDRVEAVARSYVDAGSRIILTNTFQANRYTLDRNGCSGQTIEINRVGADISKRAAEGHSLVFGSVGPTGKMLALEEVSEEELQDVFSEQIQGLVEGGVDAVVLETMSDPGEAAAGIRAARSYGVPVVACLCFDSGENLDRTLVGTTVEEGAKALADVGADSVGANCGQGIISSIGICRRLNSAVDLPIWIKANAGLPKLVDGKAVYKTTAHEFANQVPSLIEAGARFVGGCCGTNPDFIRTIAQEVLPRLRVNDSTA